MKLLCPVLVLAAAIAAVLPCSASERWIALEGGSEREPVVSVVSSDLGSLVLEVRVPGVFSEEVATTGGVFTRLTLPPCGFTSAVGEAMLPAVRRFVEIPARAKPRLRVLGVESRVSSLAALGIVHPVIPVQPPVEKVPGAIDAAQFAYSDEFYALDEPTPEEFARIGEIGTMRGLGFVQLEVNPIRYSPASGEIEFATRIEIAIEFPGADPIETRRILDRYSNPYFDRIARDMFINREAFVSRYDIALPIGYLVVVHDDFYDEILPLAEWKHRKGHQCTVVKTSQIPGGNTKENIKAYIQNAYDNWPVPPTFVLLVGDTGYIDYWVGGMSSNPSTDLYYVTMDGSGDWEPDMWIGRFSCTSPSQVANLVGKTVDYERYDLSSGTSWIKKAVFMASEDNYTVSEGTHNYVISTYLDPAGYASDKLYCHTYNATTQQVSDAFNDGRSLGIYSGHGSTTSWGDGPPFNAGNVNALVNYDMLPLIHSYSCLTGNFSSACFGETWTNATGKGALVFWGSSVTSYWDEDDILERRAFKAAFEEGYTWACGISHRGLYWLRDHYGGTNTVHRYFEMYNILGDPGVDLWMDAPAALDAAYAAVVPVGSTSFDITVTSGATPVDKALVCLYKEDDGIYEVHYTDASGQASIPLDPPPATPGTMLVTVTKHNHHPFEGTALVVMPDSPYCLYFDHSIDDDLSGGSSGNGDGRVDAGETIELVVTLENVGTQPAYGVSAGIAENDMYVVVTDGYEEYGDIPDGGTAPCMEDYDFEVAGTCPDGHSVQFEITATDGDSVWVSQFGIIVGAPVLVIDGYVLDDSPPGGNGNGCPEPGETLSLEVTLANDGSSAAEEVAVELTSIDPYVIINQACAGAALIEPGGTATLSPDFGLSLSPDTPPSRAVELALEISTVSGYEGSEILTIVTGGGIEEDFEGSGADWEHYAVTSGYVDEWHVEIYRSHSTTHSWKCGGLASSNYADLSDGALLTPSVCIGSEAEMIFWDWLDAEEQTATLAWDCALVEISTDGGSTWDNLAPVGGYSHLKNSNPMNPLPEGTPCWSGYHAWREETFDLGAYEGATVRFRFRFASDANVTEEGWYIDDVTVTSTTTGIDGEQLLPLPSEFALAQNTPNPFNPVTTIRYALREDGPVTIRIYNVAGKVVATLVDAKETAGFRSVVWDGTDDVGRKVASGVYLYGMEAGSFSDRRVMILLK